MKYHFKANEKEKKLLKFLCHISKNIYNCALYELRGQYFKEKKICTHFDLNMMLINKLFEGDIYTLRAETFAK